MQISYLYYACIHIRLITCCWFNHYYRMTTFKIETSWPWSYGGWIYNYLCNRCLTPLMFWVQIPLNARGTTLCDKVCQWLAEGQWFSQGTPVSSTNKTDCHDITEILLKVTLITIKPTNQPIKIEMVQPNIRTLIRY
jgi:hypothetical protein